MSRNKAGLFGLPDPEAPSAYSRMSRRAQILRRPKWMILATFSGIALFIYYNTRFAGLDNGLVNVVPEYDAEEGEWLDDLTEEDDEYRVIVPEPVPAAGYGSQGQTKPGKVNISPNPFKPSVEMSGSGKDQYGTYLIDEYGDYFYPDYKQPLPGFDPLPSELIDPEHIFPDLDLETFLEPPKSTFFPDDLLRQVISPPIPPDQLVKEPKQPVNELYSTGFASNWKYTEDDTDEELEEQPNIQWEGFKRGKYEDADRKTLREQRQEAVKRGFVWGWQRYKDLAWGHDEVRPVSMAVSNPFNNWGASIIDSLGTLLIMGLSEEYDYCREHVHMLNFEWNNGRDWSRGFIIPNDMLKKDPKAVEKRSDSEEEKEEERSPKEETPEKDEDDMIILGRDTSTDLGCFETTIRYLGGLISAYDLSGDKLMLERAIELANILKKSFNTASGLPSNRIDAGSDKVYTLFQVSLAEIGSISLEYQHLYQLTGNEEYRALSQRTFDYLESSIIPLSPYPPLIPLYFSPDRTMSAGQMSALANGQIARGISNGNKESNPKGNSPNKNGGSAFQERPQMLQGAFAWGGLADSYYEYLIKTYRLLKDSPKREQYKRLYMQSVDAARNLFFWDIDLIPGLDLMSIGKIDNGRPVPEVEHLTCFAGGMLALGSKLLSSENRQEDFEDARRITNTCYWLSASTPNGIQPDMVEFWDSIDNPQSTINTTIYHNINVIQQDDGDGIYVDEVFSQGERGEIEVEVPKIHHPHASNLDFEVEEANKRIVEDMNGNFRWTDDGSPVMPEDGGRNDPEPVRYATKLKGVPPGTKRVSGKYINRPETIESIYYMYRLTGDPKWQDKGWKMFVSWMRAAEAPGGFSSIADVTKAHLTHSDNMESFTFAETFKYHYLLQSDPDLISLDDYVFNTEGHPFLTASDLKPGQTRIKAHKSNKFWFTEKETPKLDLKTKGTGTHAQKWIRHELLKQLIEEIKALKENEIERTQSKEGSKGGGVRPGNMLGVGKGGNPGRGGGGGMGGGGGKPGDRPKPPPEFFMKPGTK